MARQSRKSRNELDLILEQLKRSYASDSANSLEDDLLESPTHEEDAELNEILGRIFSQEEATKQPEPIEQSKQAIAEITSDSNEQVTEAEAVNVESEPEATAEIIETMEAYEDNVEVQNVSKDSTDIDAVDNVLSIMFSERSKNGKAELGGKAVESIIEDTVPDINPEPISNRMSLFPFLILS